MKWFADPAGSAFGAMVDGFGGWMVESIGSAMESMLGLFAYQTSPDPTADWFAGDGSPYQVMWRISLSLLVLLWTVAVMQGVASGDMGQIGRRLVTRTPVAVLGAALALVVTKEMLAFTDAVSAGIAGDAPVEFAGFMAKVLELSEANGSMSMLLMLLCGFGFLVAVLVIAVELVVRNAVLYLVLAIVPLALALMVWPATQDTGRRVLKLWLGLLLMKPLIALALAVGAAALGAGLDVETGEAFADGGSLAVSGGQSLGAMVCGLAVLGMAAASPLLMGKLFPVAEGAMVASAARRDAMFSVRRSTQSAQRAGARVARLAAGGPATATMPTGGPRIAEAASAGAATKPVPAGPTPPPGTTSVSSPRSAEGTRSGSSPARSSGPAKATGEPVSNPAEAP